MSAAAEAESELQLHPLAQVLPEMPPEEYRHLVESIRRNGLRESVVLFEEKILDGRHRYRACREASVPVRTRDFQGTFAEAVELVADANLRRRHLDEGQRALVAVQLCTMAGTAGGRPRKTSSTEEVSRKDAARIAGVSVGTIDRALVVRSEPRLRDAVMRGEMSLRAAYARVRRDEGPPEPVPAAEAAPEPDASPLLDASAPGVPFWSRLYCADSTLVLADVERPDLLLTDPPYGLGTGGSEEHGEMIGDEDMKVGYGVLELAIRRLKVGGIIYCFGDGRRPYDLQQAGGPLVEPLRPLVWDKVVLGQGDCEYDPWGLSWEYVSVGQRRPDPESPEDMAELRRIYERAREQDPGELLPPDADDAEREALRALFGAPMTGPVSFDSTSIETLLRLSRPRRFRRGAVLRCPRDDRGEHKHRTVKPVDLLKELIGVSSRPYDLVLDPFAGTGATGVAAMLLGRRFLGIEKDPKHARTAARRIHRACQDVKAAGPEELRRAALDEDARWLGTREAWKQWQESDAAREWLEEHSATVPRVPK
jgi:hypothetical protein